jgi:CRP/FNR family transcriptional regulator, cyclic AMP receptor protein
VSSPPRRSSGSLLELDPDLGALLDGERLPDARTALQVPIQRLHPGAWDVSRLSEAHPGHVGLLLLDGVLAREIIMEDSVSPELLGTGDLIRPWHLDRTQRLLRNDVRWSVLADCTIAILDRHLAAALGRFPEIAVALMDRLDRRAERLATAKAIVQLNRVDRRLLALFWHLAERWGRMTGDGVAIPLTLSHRMLGDLVGARRPTVSTSLGELARSGTLVRRPDGSWLLTGEPVGVPGEEAGRFVPMRRRLMAPPGPPTRPLRAPA